MTSIGSSASKPGWIQAGARAILLIACIGTGAPCDAAENGLSNFTYGAQTS